ncbi:hypothetical protein AYO44_04770 [Planctomycetaceae bacterium SCGC AG-212-F19]|nr:hypothetical protein AYO44_04770 [Planctomycetaceae bacterium SCGC AG-212-F19]
MAGGASAGTSGGRGATANVNSACVTTGRPSSRIGHPCSNATRTGCPGILASRAAAGAAFGDKSTCCRDRAPGRCTAAAHSPAGTGRHCRGEAGSAHQGAADRPT